MTSVKFVYDESARRWDVVVEGANNDQDAIDAVRAVILTIKDTNVGDAAQVLETRADGSRRMAIGVYQ